ncbi:MAG: tetratricopeptide (TPR) repeat protein [Bacteroidia bacterium]|jgi:tetratricopeptide (TPR) repeat protein|tara:strand:- start:9799 stop:11211 length:1413 start_codon:yes stop_codon:yes gene_type:complete
MVYKKKISINNKMKKYFLFMLMAFVGMTAIAQDTDEDEDGEDDSPSACQNKWGSDSVTTAKKLSLFNQYYQEKKYVEAFPYWKYLFENAPCIQKRITYSGPYIIKKALREEEYKSRFKGLVDTLLLCHDKRIEFFGQEGYVLGKKADDMAKLSPSNREEALVLFSKSLQIQADKTKYDVPKDFIYAGVKQYKKNDLSLDSLFMILDEVTPIIEANIAMYTADSVSAKDSAMGVKWLATQDAVIGMMKPYLDCDKLEELKKPYYADKKSDITWLKSTVKLLDRGGCESKAFYLECSEALFSLEPSSEAALSLAKAFGKQGDDTKAVVYYTKAADLAPNDDAKYEIWIKLAKTAKNNQQYSTVREYARKALAINSNSGEAYILIGDAYAASATSCGSGELGRGGVYLVAVDKYARAKSVDPSAAEAAQAKINKYTGYFPGKEDAFFKGINNGDSYRVGCWIGESTTVRTIGG